MYKRTRNQPKYAEKRGRWNLPGEYISWELCLIFIQKCFVSFEFEQVVTSNIWTLPNKSLGKMGVLFNTSIAILMVRTLVLSTVVQNLTQLDNHGALWHRMGTVHTTTSYAHLHIAIRTAKLQQRKQLMKSIANWFKIL